ncbi:hypothetical protein [Terrimonas alba]|uniref:hypothetical protein n=1 Tax=Terrimonas alba TaxID=3349636 RepID=UPI0035F33E61
MPALLVIAPHKAGATHNKSGLQVGKAIQARKYFCITTFSPALKHRILVEWYC